MNLKTRCSHPHSHSQASHFSPLLLLTGLAVNFNHGLILGIGASTKILLSKIFGFVDEITVADLDSDTKPPTVSLVSVTGTADEDAVSSFVAAEPPDSRPTSGPQDLERSGGSATVVWNDDVLDVMSCNVVSCTAVAMLNCRAPCDVQYVSPPCVESGCWRRPLAARHRHTTSDDVGRRDDRLDANVSSKSPVN